MIDKNLAYNIEFFEKDFRQKKNVVKFPTKQRRQKIKKHLKFVATMFTLCAVTLIALVVAIFLNSGVQLNALSDIENRLSKILDEKKSLHTQLIVKKNGIILNSSKTGKSDADVEYIKVNIEDKSIIGN